MMAISCTMPMMNTLIRTPKALVRFGIEEPVTGENLILGFQVENDELAAIIEQNRWGADLRVSVIQDATTYRKLWGAIDFRDDDTRPYPVDFNKQYLVLIRTKQTEKGAELQRKTTTYDSDSKILSFSYTASTEPRVRAPFYMGSVIWRSEVPLIQKPSAPEIRVSVG
jgi:hypothetical protein